MENLVKSEAPEACWHEIETIIRMKCPYCDAYNKLNLGDMNDLSAQDVEACECGLCNKKFWLPGWKELHQDANGFWPEEEDLTTEELGLEPGDDLIEHAYCEKGK
jgi:formate dehydrogenase maturation protein FdhE